MVHSRPPSLLISSSSVARPLSSTTSYPSPSNSPFRYVHLPQEKQPFSASRQAVFTHPLTEDDDPVSQRSSCASSPVSVPQLHYPLRHVLRPVRVPPPQTQEPDGCHIPDGLKPWLGIASWAVTTLGFLFAIAFWKKEVFTGLDQLSSYLQSLGTLGYGILFGLIFITTVPPFPLYSTLIVLSGYTFGTWTGAVISYSAALSGAVIVFLVSRHYFRDTMSRLLSHTASLKRVVRAIERRPRLLLLIRVAPYPYNLMNVLLAASHTLSFSTYFWCTALSLCKVVIHTSVGSGIHNFAGHHLGSGGGDAQEVVDERDQEDKVGKTWTVIGILLCIGILVYLSIVARRAVDEELDDTGCRLEEGRLSVEAEMREVGR